VKGETLDFARRIFFVQLYFVYARSTSSKHNNSGTLAEWLTRWPANRSSERKLASSFGSVCSNHTGVALYRSNHKLLSFLSFLLPTMSEWRHHCFCSLDYGRHVEGVAWSGAHMTVEPEGNINTMLFAGKPQCDIQYSITNSSVIFQDSCRASGRVYRAPCPSARSTVSGLPIPLLPHHPSSKSP
jgi:hypothetical protein